MKPNEKKRFPSKRAFAAAVKKLAADAKKQGRSLADQIFQYATQDEPSRITPKQRSVIPAEIFRQIIYTSAERLKRTPSQHLKSVFHPEMEAEAPKELQNWYAQIFGEFAKGTLSHVMREVLLYAANRDNDLMPNVRSAIVGGNIKYLEQITRCVALIHGIKHEKNGQAARLVNQTQRSIGLAYLRLFELDKRHPSAREIRVLLARDACFKRASDNFPRFSDVWYLLRSGPSDESNDTPARENRYELTGIKNIKKVIAAFDWPLGRSLDGPLSTKAVKAILKRAQLQYIDDSETVTGN